MTSNEPPSEPTVVGHYRVLKKLRAGGMSEVYLAEDELLPRVVALKLLPADRSGDSILKHRLMREARAAASLSHPNIAQIYEAGEANGRVFIVMEYVEGEPLDVRISRGSLPVDDVVKIALQLVSAVETAHRGDVIHRDLKPGNVMLTPRGDIKVLDFGLAQFKDSATTAVESTAWKTQSGILLGTVPYMSPEQASAARVDHRSDIFSVGVILYELITARRPFIGATESETILRIVNSQPEAMARFNYELPLELERIIRKCLEKSPDSRYQSATELLVDLRNFHRDRQSLPGGTAPTFEKQYRRWSIVAAAVLLAATAIVFVARTQFNSGSGDATPSGTSAFSRRTATKRQNVEALRLYGAAREQWNQRTRESLYAALALYRQAIEIDDRFALAWAGLAETYSLLDRYADVPSDESRANALRAARKAIESDDTLAEAHAAFASVYETYFWRWADAEREYLKAISLNPTDPTAHHWYALLLTRLGRFGDAKQEIDLAQGFDQHSAAIAAAASNIDYYAGDFPSSIAKARAALALDDTFRFARMQLVLSLMLSGDLTSASRELSRMPGGPEALQAKLTLRAIASARSGDAAAALRYIRVAESSPTCDINAYFLAAVYMARDDHDGALRWLCTAVDERSVWVGFLAVDPLFVPLHGNPAYQQLIERVGLPANVR